MAVNYYIKLFLTDTEVYSGIFMSVLLLVAETIKVSRDNSVSEDTLDLSQNDLKSFK